MRFELANEVFDPQITDSRRIVSRSTGRELRRLTIRFGTRGADRRAQVDSFPPGTTLKSVDDDRPVHWRKVGTSSSMNDGRSSNWIHTWEIEEMEDLKVEALVINELRLIPIRYAERWRSDRLEVHALITVPAEDHIVLKRVVASDEPVTVTRAGLASEVRTMEVLDGPWSEQGGSFQWLLHLEDPRSEEDRKPSAGILMMQRTYHSVPYLLALVEDLGALLVGKGVLSQAEFGDVKERALARYRERSVEMLRVDDLNEFWDEEAFSA